MFNIFGGNKLRDKAVVDVTENLQIQLGHHIRYGNMIDKIKTDAYIAGYIQGKITSFIAYFVRAEGMSINEGNYVSGKTLINVFGDQAPDVSKILKEHAARGTQQFKNGIEKGVRVVAFAFGAQDVRQDPDYANAIAAYRIVTSIQPGANSIANDHLAAVVGFEELWFGSHLSK